VIITDEALFTRDGILNIHDQHLWADQNPYGIPPSHHQQPFSIKIWAVICGDNLFGLSILLKRLIGRNYKFSMENNMPDFLADVPLIILRELNGTSTKKSGMLFSMVYWYIHLQWQVFRQYATCQEFGIVFGRQ
jgi:hypothetical protein